MWPEHKLRLVSLALNGAFVLGFAATASARDPHGQLHIRADTPRARYAYYGWLHHRDDGYRPSYTYGPFYRNGWWGPDPNHQDYGYW
jgi:hypothetical protein